MWQHAFAPACVIGLLLAGTESPAGRPDGGWPQWRGPARTGHASPGAAAPTALPRQLQPAWKISVGGGFSSPVVAADKLVYLDEQEGKEVVHVLNTRDGRELWRTAFSEAFGDEWGTGPRSTPLIDGSRVYAQSCRGEFACLNLAEGRVLWRASFEKDFGVRFLGGKAADGTATRRGNNGCGVIDGDRLVLPVGSTQGASLVCFDKGSGRVLWKSGKDEAAYSSLMVATLAGIRQVVAFNADALLGADLSDGRVLWRVPVKTAAKRHAATPVILDDRVVVNSHSVGLLCFGIAADSGGQKATEVWANRNLRINIATPVAVNGHLYSQGPNRDFVCIEAATGQLKWSRPGFGQGRKDYSSTIAVGERLIVLTEDGTLLLLAADPSKYTELGRLQVCGNTWSFPAYANGRLFVRDAASLAALELMVP